MPWQRFYHEYYKLLNVRMFFRAIRPIRKIRVFAIQQGRLQRVVRRASASRYSHAIVIYQAVETNQSKLARPVALLSMWRLSASR
jgi:hypothetical protein